MKLSTVAKILEENSLLSDSCLKSDPEFNYISCDSRKIEKNTLFFAKGVNFKDEYLLSAINKGAICYIGDKSYNVDIPYLTVKNIRLAMPLIANAFYQKPASKYPLVGITGTKGKTSTAYMLKNIFNNAFGEEQNGIISTNEALCGTEKIEKSFTTPEALELYSILKRFAEKNIKAAVMEVSSQGLQYNRVEYVDFFVGIFLNLSPDHISPTEHKDFNQYKNAKMRMLTLCKNGIVNIDDEYAADIIAAAKCEKLYTIAIEKAADFRAKEIIVSKKGVSFKVFGNYINNQTFELKIPGEFNIYNALAAIASAYIMGIDVEIIKKALAETVITGRMEIIEKKGKTIIIDYAHNALSFNAVFDYVSSFYPQSRTICVFGCQGEKALGRRKELPAIAGKKASFVVLTSDDPASEEPEVILQEVEENLKKTSVDYTVIVDRESAVKYAISKAKEGDVVILAGKGHEKTQQVKGKLVYYKGDMDSAIEALE